MCLCGGHVLRERLREKKNRYGGKEVEKILK